MESSLLAYGGDSQPKEHGGRRHKAVDVSHLRKLLPLDIAGSDKERNEDTCETDPASIQFITTKR